MRHDVALLARLRVRHARTRLARLAHFAGADVVEESSPEDRIYQVYVLAAVAIAFALLWLWALAQVESAFALLTPSAAYDLLRACFLCLAAAFGVSCLKAMYGDAYSFSASDVAHVIASPVRIEAVMLVELAVSATKAALAGGFAGYAVGVACAAAGMAVAPVVVMFEAALAFAAVAGAPQVVKAFRVFCPRVAARKAWGAREARKVREACASGEAHGASDGLAFEVRFVRQGVAACVVTLAIAGVAAFACMPHAALAGALSWQVALLLAGIVSIEVAATWSFGRRVDASALSQEVALFADLPKDALSTMMVALLSGSHALKDEKRRRKVAHRTPRGKLPDCEGAKAVMARSLLSVRRQREGWPSLALAGGFLAPCGALVLSLVGPGAVDLSYLLMWLILPQCCLHAVGELGHAFSDDMKVPLVRDRIPYGDACLFALDALPAFAVATVCQLLLAVVLVLSLQACSVSVGGDLLYLCGLSFALLVGLTLCNAFDVIRLPFGRHWVVGRAGAAFVLSVVTSAAALAGASLPALLVVAVVVCVAMALAAARWME